jgi:hypothetical protein
MALRALVGRVSELPRAAMPALRAGEAVRPTQPVQVVQAVGVGAKPRLELAKRTWIVLSGLGTGDPAIYLLRP